MLERRQISIKVDPIAWDKAKEIIKAHNSPKNPFKMLK